VNILHLYSELMQSS